MKNPKPSLVQINPKQIVFVIEIIKTESAKIVLIVRIEDDGVIVERKP